MPRLLSVNVGLPREVVWRGKTVHTAIWKDPVQGRRMVRRLNIDGDGQGDLRGHGGEQRAVFAYQIESYRYWEDRLRRSDFVYGQFGENFTVEGMSDDDVCIGDRYRIGKALFEVSQPRVTCYRVGIRMDEPTMAALLTSSGRPGFYFRVLEEGEVEAGDEIVKVSDGPERMSVTETNALLYLPGHSREQLERALRIPALSGGWRTSFQALLQNDLSATPMTGNPGLGTGISAPPAWPGFRPLRVSRIDRESASIISVVLVPGDGHPLVAAAPGQFVVLRLRPNPDAPALLRSYSLSDAPSADHYRVSIKQELNGLGSTYLHKHVKVGDVLDVSAPRGSFTLQSGERPVVLLSAGVGATPVLAMLHALAAEKSTRQIWWLYGARSRSDHPFAQESCDLVQALSHSRSRILYSRPGPEDRLGLEFDATGHLGIPVLAELAVPRDADFYLCGPAGFLRDLRAGLSAWGIAAGHVHLEIFGPGESLTPGIAAATARPVHAPAGAAGQGPQVSFARSGLTVRWDTKYQSLLELAEACDVPVRWSCRTGVCHNCQSGLISGAVSYRPEPLDQPAAGDLLICCSQPQEDVVIDL
ncbi:MAG TPA: MOSC and FAD-binding oxidoreductase domain-containing protein [Candidatus Binatia bacterium]